MVYKEARSLDRQFAALADPTRRAMLARLAQGRANVTVLAKPFLRRMSLPAVTKHLRVLEAAGLIIKTREAQARPCELNGAGLREVADWVAQYKASWEDRLDRLDAFLKATAPTRLPKNLP